MESRNVLDAVVGRVGSVAGGATGVAVADHSTAIQGALVVLAGVAIDLAVRYIRARFR